MRIFKVKENILKKFHTDEMGIYVERVRDRSFQGQNHENPSNGSKTTGATSFTHFAHSVNMGGN